MLLLFFTMVLVFIGIVFFLNSLNEKSINLIENIVKTKDYSVYKGNISYVQNGHIDEAIRAKVNVGLVKKGLIIYGDLDTNKFSPRYLYFYPYESDFLTNVRFYGEIHDISIDLNNRRVLAKGKILDRRSFSIFSINYTVNIELLNIAQERVKEWYDSCLIETV